MAAAGANPRGAVYYGLTPFSRRSIPETGTVPKPRDGRGSVKGNPSAISRHPLLGYYLKRKTGECQVSFPGQIEMLEWILNPRVEDGECIDGYIGTVDWNHGLGSCSKGHWETWMMRMEGPSIRQSSLQWPGQLHMASIGKMNINTTLPIFEKHVMYLSN